MGPQKTWTVKAILIKKNKAAVSHSLIQIILSYKNQNNITLTEKTDRSVEQCLEPMNKATHV